MAYFLFKCWHEQLFFAERERAVPGVTDLPVTLVPITEENAALVRDLRGARFDEQFRYQLSLGDFGYYACLDGKPIGYGWAKHAGSDDYFFKIGAGCVYLCRFFVHESARGHGVTPPYCACVYTGMGIAQSELRPTLKNCMIWVVIHYLLSVIIWLEWLPVWGLIK